MSIRIVFMKARLRVSAALVRTEIAAIRAERPDLAEDALRQFVHSHRETVRLTRSRANVRRLRVNPALGRVQDNPRAPVTVTLDTAQPTGGKMRGTVRVLYMTKLLEKALEEVAKLPASEQDAVAAIVLEELASEQRWADLFAKSQDKLAKLALAEHNAGRKRPL